MAEELGAAVWGAGWVSGEHLRAYAGNAHCRVVALGSRTEKSCRARLAETGLEGVAHHPFQDEIDHFVECILTDTESHASVLNTAHAHEICLAMDQSAANGGQPVRLPL